MSEDMNLEVAIDEVGRYRAFVMAHSYGWTHGPPPKFIWWGIVQQLREEDQANAGG